MAPAPCALGAQHQQQATSHQAKKHKGGLLSRLFGSLQTGGRAGGRGGGSLSSGPRGPVTWAPLSPATVACSAVATALDPTTATTNQCSAVPYLGYSTNIEQKYEFDRELGTGGNGVVRVARDKSTGEEFACKSIRKVLGREASENKRKGHLDSVRREVQVLTKLKGSLNIVKLEDVYEDDDNVHIVMELCQGGELWHRIGDSHYSERTVASFMRAVLRTLAQCHAQHILHRDVKPGNFMLLTGDDRAPLKAIDFGLAAPFDPEHLPRTDLGLEGTPWYMAPETLSGKWLPASDLWAAGVMAFQMLCGRFPFDDKKNVYAPAITAIWRSVLNDQLDFNKPWWAGISEEAKDFCRLLLNRDPALRPTAKEALKHPWLRGNSSERSTGKKLGQSVVARIQRFASGSQLKRTVLQSIAAELLSQPHLLASAGAELGGDRCAMDSASGRPIVATPDSACLAPLMAQLHLDTLGGHVDEATLSEALAAMGFKLAPSEVSRLMEQVDLEGTGEFDRAAFAASQMDWRHLQQNHAELWLDLAAKAFRDIDTNGSGVLEVDELLQALRARLPADEVHTALELALQDAAGLTAAAAVGYGAGGGVGNDGVRGIDFESFVALLKVGSMDSLDLYDDRMSNRSGGSGHGSAAGNGSMDRYNSLLAASLKTSDWSRHGPGSSRHGVEASGHSALSERSDVSALHDNDRDRDRSMRGGSGMAVPGQQQGQPFQFRFEGETRPAAPKVAIIAASVAGGSIAGGSAGGGVSTGRTGGLSGMASGGAAAGAGSAGGMVWRFDVAGHALPTPPPPAAPVWRFDVAGSRDRGKANANAWDQTGEVGAAAIGAGDYDGPGAVSASGGSGSGGSGSGGSGSGSGRGGSVVTSALNTSVTGHYLGRQGGYFDRRHHGSTLYRNAALGALYAATNRLHTVAE